MADQVPEEIPWSTEYCLLSPGPMSNRQNFTRHLSRSFSNMDSLSQAADQAPRLLFPISSVERLRRIIRIRRDLRVNMAGIAVILEMRQHLEELQKELEPLRHSAGAL